MIKTRIEEYDDRFRNNVIRKYYNLRDLNKLERHFNLSRNEVLAILIEAGVKDNELKSVCSSFNFYDDSFIVISDTHFGSKLENEDYLKEVYNFALKLGIKHIFHTGDLLQSTIKPVNPRYSDVITQANHMLDIYPESKKVTNHILLGNHDLHAIEKKNDVFKILSSRKDFDILGFKKVYFKWNNYLLSMSHDLDKYHLKLPNINQLIRFAGHRHSLNIVGDSTIFSPTLSDDLKYYNSSSEPGFLFVIKENDRMKVFYITINLEQDKKLENQGIILSKKMTGKYRV